MNHLYDLQEIDSSDRSEVGNKAIALSQLYQQGYPVPPGIVVGCQALTAFFPEASAFNGRCDRYETLQQTAEQLCRQVRQIAFEPEWINRLYHTVAAWETNTLIFRPSLVLPPNTSSVSGLFDSQCCFCDKQELAWALKQVWESLFHAHSLFYWQQQGIGWEQLGLAVIIQPIQSAIASGIIEVRETQWQIQAVWGLGHSLARGEALPETYEINPATQQWQLHQLGYQTRIYHLQENHSASLLKVRSPEEDAEKAVLTPDQLSALIRLAADLQAIAPHPFRCEWTLAAQSHPKQIDGGSKLYLTQFSVQEQSSSEATVTEQSRSNLIVKGIGAGKGKATGKVYIVGRDDDREFPAGGILVANMITAGNLPLIKTAGGLVTEQGGMTSHGAILARELNIPAVVGAEGAVEKLREQKQATVDGDRGEVLHVSETPESGVEETAKEEQTVVADRFPLGTQLMVNVSQRDRAAALSQYPVDGIGLLRSELMLLELLQDRPLCAWLASDCRETFIQQLADLIGEFADAFFPRPVFYRSTDWLSLEQQDATLLGKRGTYNYVQDSDFFSAQMFALRHLQRQGYSNINLILPFVRDVAEVKFCKTLLKEIGLGESCQVWMMAEVPSVVYLLPQYIEAGIDGIAIGTNDLTQLLLGADRDQGEFRQQYNECHPAVMQMLKDLIEKAREGGIACSVCGQGAVLYPEIADRLVRWGITTVSVEESGIEPVYRAIARAEKRLLLDAARQQLNND